MFVHYVAFMRVSVDLYSMHVAARLSVDLFVCFFIVIEITPRISGLLNTDRHLMYNFNMMCDTRVSKLLLSVILWII